MTSSTKTRYAGHRFPPELISYTVWLYFRFPLGLRMVEEMLAFRGIEVSHETIRQWGLKFGQAFATIIRRRLPRPGDKWHMDEVVLKIAGKKHYLWRAVDQHGILLDVLVQSRRNKKAAKRLLRKLLKKQMRPPRVLIIDLAPRYRTTRIAGSLGTGKNADMALIGKGRRYRQEGSPQDPRLHMESGRVWTTEMLVSRRGGR